MTVDAGARRSHSALVEIESIKHKRLRVFAETGKAKGLVGDVDRIRKMLAYIAAIEGEDELYFPPNYAAHMLSGDRAGTWSLTVTRNWRLTFRVVGKRIVDMDLEDYH